MLKLKGCPKCQGALYLASDMYGKYINCLQCGFTKDLPEVPVQPVAAQATEPAFQPVERKAA